jgi:hypothetical protein
LHVLIYLSNNNNNNNKNKETCCHRVLKEGTNVIINLVKIQNKHALMEKIIHISSRKTNNPSKNFINRKDEDKNDDKIKSTYTETRTFAAKKDISSTVSPNATKYSSSSASSSSSYSFSDEDDYLSYDDSEYVKRERCFGHRRETRAYAFCLNMYCLLVCLNNVFIKRLGLGGLKKKLTNLLENKGILLSGTGYIVVSSIVMVLKIRIYKNMLVYSFVHHLLVNSFLQALLISPGVLFYLAYYRLSASSSPFFSCFGSRRDENALFFTAEERRSCCDPFSCPEDPVYDRTVDVSRGGTIYFNVKSKNNKSTNVMSSSRSSFVKDEPPPTISSKDCFVASRNGFTIFSAFVWLLVGTLRVLPDMVLPPILLVLSNQFGLFFMVLISRFYSKRKFDKVQLLCLFMITVGLLQDVIPDAEQSLDFSKNYAHDFFWRNTVYHVGKTNGSGDEEKKATQMNLFNLKSIKNTTIDYGLPRLPHDESSPADIEYKDSVLFTGHFVNGSIFDLTQCLNNFNVSLQLDQKTSFKKYEEAVYKYDAAWWEANDVAFVISVILALLATLPDCFGYATMEKFWKTQHDDDDDENNGVVGEEREGVEGEGGKVSTLKRCFLGNDLKVDTQWGVFVCKTIYYKALLASFSLPFFMISNENFGNYHYLKYGVYCSFDTLNYVVRGIGNVSSYYNITSIGLEGDATNRSYWECSPWRNGLNCDGMKYYTFILAALDLVQYALYVKLIKDTSDAKATWLLSIVKIGVTNVLFSVPILAGSLFVSYRYYDFLSLIIVSCATLIYWMHRAKKFKPRRSKSNRKRHHSTNQIASAKDYSINADYISFCTKRKDYLHETRLPRV